MNRNIRTIITNKQGLVDIKVEVMKEPDFKELEYICNFKYTFRPFWDLHHTEKLIKERKLPDGRTKYYIRTNVRR